jgi:hypothetical protein
MVQFRQLVTSFIWGFLFGLLVYWLCERSPMAQVVIRGMRNALQWTADRLDNAAPKNPPVPREAQDEVAD